MASIDEIQELLEQRRQKRQPQEVTKPSVEEYVEKYNLNKDDMRVAELINREEVEDPEKEVLKLAARMHYSQPTDADKPSEVAKERVPFSPKERLMQEYIAGSRNLSGRELIAYKMRMREKGLEIY